MLRLLLIMVVLSATIFIAGGEAALAFQAIYQLPCAIFYPNEAPIVVTCVASIKASGKSWIEFVQTKNGRSFIIEKDGSAQWYLNHKPSQKVSDEPNTCYQNREVKLCL